jgi:Uma2 family endonuclease
VVLSTHRPRVRFTTTDVLRMLEVGILSDDPRIELLDGDLVAMSPEYPRHSRTVRRLVRWLRRRLEAGADEASEVVVFEGHTVELGPHWLPTPDIAVLLGPEDRYDERWPRPDDILLAIEVCDATLDEDRRLKVPGYAQAGLPMVWLVDVRRRRVLVFTSPGGDRYASERAYGRGQLVPLWLPSVPPLAVDDLFGAGPS